MGLLRLLLSVAVIVEHMRLSRPFMIWGGDAVKIFFMISGFYMAMILLEKYGNSRKGLTTFAINRFLRLYPVYITVLIISIIWFIICKLSTHGGTPDTDLLKLSHILPLWQSALLWLPNLTLFGIDLPSLFHWSQQNGFQIMTSLPHEDVNGNFWIGNTVWVRQAWSVGSEIWFYLLSPLIVFGSLRRIIGFGLISIVIGLYCTLYLQCSSYFFWPAQLVYFVVGILLYKIYVSFDLQNYLPNSNISRFLLAGSPIFWIIILPFFGHPLKEYFLFPVAAISIPILFSITKYNKIDRDVGNLSYCTYLNHLLVMSVVAVILKRLHGLNYLYVPLVISGSLTLAFILEWLVDSPMEKFRAAFANKKLKSVNPS